METVRHPLRIWRVALAVIAWFNLVSALFGMVGLIAGFLGLPAELIQGSVFSSYFWPGVILGFVVGGSQALALAAQYGRYRLAWGMHAAAGLILMIWMFVEVVVIQGWSPLYGVYYATGLLQVVVAVLALGAWPHPFLTRSERPESGGARAH